MEGECEEEGGVFFFSGGAVRELLVGRRVKWEKGEYSVKPECAFGSPSQELSIGGNPKPTIQIGCEPKH